MAQASNEQRLSIKQVADYLGVTPQRVSQLHGRPDFPRPMMVGFRDMTWSGTEIRRWADDHPCGRRRWGRPLTPLAPRVGPPAGT
jgi:predicted DNA-binding transcriptional regulator AlpA